MQKASRFWKAWKQSETLPCIRHRPRHHLFTKCDNSIDEALVGYCDAIEWLSMDNSITITDNGRGIPTGMHERKKSALE